MKRANQETAESDRPSYLLITRTQWIVVLLLSGIAAAAAWPLCRDNNPRAIVPVAMAVGVALHLAFATRRIAPIPQVAILIAVLQCGLAAWASQYYPTQNPTYSIASLNDYLGFANPALGAVILGWMLPLIGLRTLPVEEIRKRVAPNLGLKKELDLLLFGGIAMNFVTGHLELGSLSFVGTLLGNLRYVGAIGFLIFGIPGWRKRLAFLFLIEVSMAMGTGMFHDLVLWGLSLFAIYSFLRRTSPFKQLVFFGLISLAVFLLHDVKWQVRRAFWNDVSSTASGHIMIFDEDHEMNRWNRPYIGTLCLVQSVNKLFSGGFDAETLGDFVMRFNQGWIIDRVRRHVPQGEPYARGRTIIAALKASVLPRFLAPDKAYAGGRALMLKYADYTLGDNTAMNLSFVGEAYANFGQKGGVAVCFGYCLMFGLLFRWAAVRAQRSPLWWGVAAYVGHWAFKAESDIGSVLNYVVKASVLIVGLLFVLPALRAELTGRQPGLRPRRPGGRDPAPALEHANPAPSWSHQAPAPGEADRPEAAAPPIQPPIPMPASDFVREERA